jgi:hypothetical protein
MSDTKKGGLGIGTVVLIIFIILKLAGVLAWFWWIVFIPLWIELGTLIILIIITFIIYVIRR